jgi:O-antigen/teichoic acid export membrane protein
MTPRALLLFALGPIGSAILGLAIVPLSAWVFAAEDIGRLNLLQTISALAVTGAFLGLDQAYVREFNESAHRRGLATIALGMAVLTFIAVALPFSLHASWTSDALYGISSPWLTWASLLSILLALLLRQWTLVARMSERSGSFLWAQLGPRLVMLIGLVLVLLTQLMPRFEVLLWINVACNLAGVLILGIALSRDVAAVLPPPGWLRLLRRMLKYSIPLALGAFAYVALTSINTFIVRVEAGFEELGVFAVALGVASAAGIVQQIFSVVWSPVSTAASHREMSSTSWNACTDSCSACSAARWRSSARSPG